MNYETLIALMLVLLIVISFCIHIQNNKEPLENKPKQKTIKIRKRNLAPIGKSFAEFIPPKTKCDPEKGCHTGSYTAFSRNT
tara:strand:- start:707 stop:952 length:246 start_codon:yes stop_codon:yes gene_type:complete